MTGQLITSFLDSSERGASRWLEIWLFDDATLNLVVATESDQHSEEFSFPCAMHHLRNVLSGLEFQTVGVSGHIRIWRDDSVVIADFAQTPGTKKWTLEIPVEEVASGIEEVERVASRYVA